MLLLSLLLLLQWSLTSGAADPTFLVTVTSQAVGGSTETLCAQIHDPKEPLSLVVTLRNVTILKQDSIKQDFYKCVSFKVPLVSEETVASIGVVIRGGTTSLSNSTQILINPPRSLIFIQSDKPIYKPGETTKFRIVSLDSNFLPLNQVFKTVELQDPNSNRINQWLNQLTKSGILDLFHSISPDATQGFYTITAWDEKNQQISHKFEIKEYVLPKYEVKINFPTVITSLDKEVTLKVCAKYTYGKPVLGSVNAEVCGHPYIYYFRYDPIMDKNDTCKRYSMMADKTGCGSWVINVTEFDMFKGVFRVNANVDESGTGISMSGTTSAEFTSDNVYVNFKDTSDTYRPGMLFKGKVVVTNIQHIPMKNEPVIVFANYGNNTTNVTLMTDITGTASFSLNTSVWSEKSVTLRVEHKGAKELPYFGYWSGYLHLRPFHSKSKSFLILMTAPAKLSCNGDATMVASYIIQGNALKPGQNTLDFFYIVLSKGSMAQNGRFSVTVKAGKENKGELTFSLKKTAALIPFAQVVVYTILPSGEAVADSMNFPIEECLPNKVSLKFSAPTAQPGEKTSLNLKANPNSLCSVRAIDQSVLLLRPEAELNAAFIYRMLPVQKLSGYPYNIEEFKPHPCLPPFPLDESARRRRSLYYPYLSFKKDVYNIFRDIGIRIVTNADVKAPVMCDELGRYRTLMEDVGLVPVRFSDDKIRKFFPETWIWDLIPVGRSGSVDVPKTVPDTITKWAAGAFCTSPLGFGLAPSINLTAFKPFFVSLILPYSVIREETFTLKASVFNYLPKCIMVKVTLVDSQQFKAQPCKNCTYTQCVCSEESKIFQWIVTPSALGKVNITVRAEAVQSREMCGNEVVTFPDRGRIDTLMQSVLVEAEGTKRSIARNELVCLTGHPQETTVSLTLPQVFVKDSAKVFLTVLGDLMGRSLNNIANLLAMPYGCGEQNMLLFAPNIYILQYLESSGQLTTEIKNRAKTFLEGGYQRELTYKHYNGSYSAFGANDPSGNTWLTAFVMKAFGGAKKYIYIDQTNIDQAKDWLGQQQKDNGCFASVGRLYHIKMMGGVSDEVTLSAYITAALLELGVQKSDAMVVKSLACIKEASKKINNTYVTALLAYTFTLAGDVQMRENLLSRLDMQAKREGIVRYWTLANNAQMTGSLEVEMTAYVLLALLSGPSLPKYGTNYSSGIVYWLAKQQNAFGGFSSTQDTVIALQALAKYSAAIYNPEGSISVTVTSPSGQKNQFTVNRNNRLLYQEKQLQETTGTYKLKAEGKGCVFVQFALHYNIPPPPDSLSFSVKANTGVCNKTRNGAFTLTVTVRYNGTREETNMVIINVRLLSGFKLDETSLQALKEDPTVKRVALDEDHVIIYLDGLKKKQEQTFRLQLLQDVLVQNLKPAVVKVYDYYKISEFAVFDYTSPCA